MTPITRTGHAYDWEQARLNRIAEALRESELAFARVQGMKLRAKTEPKQIDLNQRFPYPGRTCAEWMSA